MKPRLGKPPLGVGIPADGPLSVGLYSAWLLNEGAGTTLNEAGRRGASVSFNGASGAVPTWAIGKEGPALKFLSASSEYVDLGVQSSVRGLSQFSMWCRVYFFTDPSPSTGNVYREPQGSGSHHRILLTCGGGLFFFDFGPTDGVAPTITVSTAGAMAINTWYDVVIVWDGVAGQQRLYLNGVLNKTTSFSAGSSFSNTAPVSNIILGGPPPSPNPSHNGLIEGFAIWNRPLSLNEVLALLRNPYQAFAWPQRRAAGGPRTPVAYSITLTESSTLVASMNKQPQISLEETATLTALLAKQARKVIANSVTLNDALSRFTARQLVETAALADTRVNFLRRLFSEGVVAADSVALHVVVKTIILSETVTLFDTRRSLIRRTFAEVATLADSAVVSHLFLKTLLEGVTLADSRTSKVSRGFAEAAVLNDVLSLKTMFARTLAETIAATDSIVRRTSRSLPESLVLIDDLKRLLSRAMLEMTVLADAVAKTVTRDLSEAVVLADSLHTHRSVEALFVETMLALDNLVRTAGKSLPETITTTDQFHFDMAREFVEAVQATDALGLGRYLTLTEAVALVDAVLTAIVPNPAQVVESVWSRAPQKLVWGRIGAKLVWHRNGGQ
jgi:hypothetical protein